jgi:hypothetical protein
MGRSLFRRCGNDRHFQASADDFGNVAHGHSFFGHCVIPRAFLKLLLFQVLEHQPVAASRIEDVHRRPAVASVAHISRHALLAS